MGLLDFKKTLEQAKYDLLQKPKEDLLSKPKRELLGETETKPDVLVEFDEEKSFTSRGTNNLKRYYQALKYGDGIYGMECNACCVMYFLQSYGLIPPNISRKQFEYAFTPLNPAKEVRSKSENKNIKSKEGFSISGKILKPIEYDLFKNIFPAGTEKFLRGELGAIFPHIVESRISLFKILKSFYSLSFEKEYTFLQKYHRNAINGLFYDDEANNPFQNCYQILREGFLTNSYFEQGNTILVAVDYDISGTGRYSSYEHYCIVTNPKKITLEIENIEYHFYPVDDPLNGSVHVVVPHTSKINTLKTKFREYLKTNGISGSSFLNIISPNAAIGV